MRRRLGALISLLPLLVGFDVLQSPHRAVEQGNARFKEGQTEKALEEYDKAVRDLPADPGVHFNRGTALFALSRFDEAAQAFLRATDARTVPLKTAAFYNLGNSFFKAEKYADAVAAYRRALTFDPTHQNAKWNLELALQKKDQKQKEEEEEKQSQKDQQKQNPQDPQDKSNPQDQKSEQASQGQNQQGQQDQQNQQGPQKQKDQGDQAAKAQDPPAAQKSPPQPPGDRAQEQQPRPAAGEPSAAPKPETGPDLQEIEAILDGLERSPKDLERERAQLRAVRRAPPAKDW